jgi:single-stranded DNA-binding protein
MNRVVLCGRLAERPRLSTSPTGLMVAVLRLQVPRQGQERLPQAMDVIDCLAFDALARELHLRAAPGLQINLEGRLLSSVCSNEAGHPAPVYRVAVEAAYWLEPRVAARELASPAPAPQAGGARSANGEHSAETEPPPHRYVRVRELLARVATRLTGANRKPGLNGAAGAGPCPSL